VSYEIGVWLQGREIGVLSSVGGRLSFRYTPHWLAQTAAVALSHSLPLRAEAFEDQACRAVFAGLLPEGHLSVELQ
jgi:serine/threonine-protein kinase HipA